MVDGNGNKLGAFISYPEVQVRTGIDSFTAKKSACGLECPEINVKFVEKKLKNI
jgi:hypothetical protein